MNVVILTGAGISAESGIRTFRGGDGLWENHRLEDVATPEAFARDPELVQRFYNDRRAQLLDPAVAPNPAHEALARLERKWAHGRVLVVTQNVDNLHRRAGSRELIAMHGSLQQARCSEYGTVHEWTGALDVALPCPCCQRPGALRPHIVWFGEIPLEMERIQEALSECDLFAAIGTSGQVYPAAGFVAAVPENCHTIELNLEPSAISRHFHEKRYGPASRTVPGWVDELLSSTGKAD